MSKPYVPVWSHVRIHASILTSVAERAVELMNRPATEWDAESIASTAETVERSATMLALIAAGVDADPKPPKGKPKPADASAFVVPPLAEGGCRVMHGLAVGTAEVATEAARLGVSKAAAFVPGAMRALAEKVTKLAEAWEAPLFLIMRAHSEAR